MLYPEKISLICAHCSRVFLIAPWRMKHNNGRGPRYCSDACYLQHVAAQVTRICQQCDASFFVKAGSLQRPGAGSYCSRACMYAAHRRSVPLACAHCGQIIVRPLSRIPTSQRASYCSLTCYWTFSPTRLWEKVARCAHEPWCLYCCWLWQGDRNKYGYGIVIKEKKKHMAHRVMWEIYNGRTLPTHTTILVVQHLCHTKACVNPWHLMFSTQQENMIASVRLGQKNHKLTPADVQQIRLLAQQKIPRKEIARQFEVSFATIKKVISREHWTHIP